MVSRRKFLQFLGLVAITPLVPTSEESKPVERKRDIVDLYLSEEALADIRLWTRADIDDKTRQEIFKAGTVYFNGKT